MRVHLLDDWHDTLRGLPCFGRLDGHAVTVWTDHEPDPARLAARMRDAEALCLFRERTPVTAALLDGLPDLRLISLRGATPHVDLAACAARGVTVSARPSGGTPPHATAELTILLIMAAFRDLPAQMDALRAGRWQAGVGQGVHGKRLGLWGFGRIGRAVAAAAEALGMAVWWWGSPEGRARARASGAVVAPDRRAFFEGSDAVSLHVRLTPETRGMVTAADLAAMPDRAILANTARAGLVAEGALEREVARGRLRAAVDVFPHEPMRDPAHPLLGPGAVATPHVGHVTEEELDLQFADVFAQVAAFAKGRPVHRVA